jgi:glycosyltransferase involved in cell wall biosynthesis
MKAAPVERTVRRVALLPWGDVIEDFLAGIGMTFDQFRDEMTGGWLFGYVEALRLAHVETVIVCVSAEVDVPTRHTHRPTGATICVLPAPAAYRRLRRHMRNPPVARAGETSGQPPAPGLASALRDVASYLATPPRLLARTVRREDCDAILCQEYEYPRFDVCVAVGRLLRRPVFGVFQGGDFQVSRLERLVRPLTLHRAAGLIIGGREEVARVRARYGTEGPVACIPNPLAVEQWRADDRAAARATLELPATARVVIWHGRIDIRRKGLDVLLDAWDRLCRDRSGRDVRLLLVGSGHDADEFRAMLARRRPWGVGWLDAYLRDPARLRQHLSASDVYVLPSRHEGFPVALLEAMACSLPVVATAVGGVADIVGCEAEPGGMIVPPGQPDALAAALERLVDDQAGARAMGERARRRVEERFSLAAVGARLADFLQAPGRVTCARESS